MQDPPEFFLKPSCQSVKITNEGKIIDIAPGQLLGLWEPTGQCLDIYPNLITSIFSKILLVNHLEKQLLVIVSEKQLKIYDFKQKILVSQFQTNNFFDDLLQNLENEDEIVGINNGNVSFISLKEQKVTKTINTQTKSRSMIQLRSGQFIIGNNDGISINLGELFLIEGQTTRIINTSGHIFSFCALEGTEFAIGRNQSIQIVDAPQNAIKSILKGYDEIYTCLHQKEKYLFSGSNNGNVRIWNIRNYRCIQCISNPMDIEYSTLIINSNMVLAGNSESRRIRIWSQNFVKEPLKQIHLFEGDLINIQKLVGLGNTYIGILCYAYYYENEFKIFLQEIRVYDIKNQKLMAKKQIDRGQYIVEPSSMKNVLNNKLLYCQNSISIQKSTLFIWDFQTEKQAIFEFNVEKPQNAIFYPFNRVVVPYCLSFMAGGNIYMKGPSGISVYDFQVEQPLLKISFDYDLNDPIVEMSDKNTLFFVNQKNSIEKWDLKLQQMVRKIDCNTNIFNKFQICNKLQFLINQHNDLIIWDSQFNIKNKFNSLEFKVINMQANDKHVYILFENGKLERYSLDQGINQKCNLQQQVKDFTLQNDKLITSGETLVQYTSQEKLF